MQAIRALIHVSPYEEVEDERQELLAQVGGLLVNEGIHNTRALPEKPMTIQFIDGGPRMLPVNLEKLAGEGQPPQAKK